MPNRDQNRLPLSMMSPRLLILFMGGHCEVNLIQQLLAQNCLQKGMVVIGVKLPSLECHGLKKIKSREISYLLGFTYIEIGTTT